MAPFYNLVSTTSDWLVSKGVKRKEAENYARELFSALSEDAINKNHAYFIHSYEFIHEDKKNISITTNYGKDVIAAVSSENIFGSQFHPEKSQNIGIKILTNFLNL